MYVSDKRSHTVRVAWRDITAESLSYHAGARLQQKTYHGLFGCRIIARMSAGLSVSPSTTLSRRSGRWVRRRACIIWRSTTKRYTPSSGAPDRRRSYYSRGILHYCSTVLHTYGTMQIWPTHHYVCPPFARMGRSRWAVQRNDICYLVVGRWASF